MGALALCESHESKVAIMAKIDPKEIHGPWDKGYVLDRHTISSTLIGQNEFGHPEFDTVRSELGELVYKAKYKGDKEAAKPIAETVAEFLKRSGLQVDVIVPIPPSRQRIRQPLFEIATALADLLQVPVDSQAISKTKGTPQMKDVGDYSERIATLKGAFTVSPEVKNKNVLLIDDLFQSGATMTVAARAIKDAGAKAVYAIALTRTRN